jgi:hypothetical protein
MNALYEKQTFSLSLRSSISVRNGCFSVVSMNALYKQISLSLCSSISVSNNRYSVVSMNALYKKN